MKVTFKLSRTQAQTAAAVLVRVAMDKPDEPVVADLGNLLVGAVERDLQYLNTDQNLSFDPATSTVTYEGSRHPMQRDGSYNALAEIAGYGPEPDAWRFAVSDGWRKLRVTDYKTSDKSMYWHETLDDTLLRLEAERGLTDGELRKHAGSGRTVSYTVREILIKRLSFRGTVPAPGTPEYRKASAEGTLPTPRDMEVMSIIREFFPDEEFA